MSNRVGGIIFIKVDGEQYRAKGSFTINYGIPKKEAVVGHDGSHGYKEIPQTPFIEGPLTDDRNISLEKLLKLEDATVTCELANGKVAVLRNAWFAGDGNLTTEEGEIDSRFEGLSAEEIRA